MVVSEVHDTLSTRQSKVLHEHEGQWMIDFAYRMVSRLRVVSRHISGVGIENITMWFGRKGQIGMLGTDS